MDRILKTILIALLALTVRADESVFQPTEYFVPSSLTIDSGVPLLGTWDFTGATVIGIGGGGGGTVTSITATAPIVVTPSSIVSTGVVSLDPTSKSNWDTGFSERRQWDGGNTNLVSSTGRTSLGATTAGVGFFTMTTPIGTSFPKVDNTGTVTNETAATHRTSIGLAIGTNVEAWSTNLDTWSGKTPYAGTLTITSGQTLNVTSGGTLGSAAYTASSAYEVPLTFTNSLARGGNSINLQGDSPSPGASFYYGTNASGTKGFFIFPSGSGNVSNSGTPSAGQLASWTDSTHIQGIAAPTFPAGTIVGTTDTQTLTNKRINPRVTVGSDTSTTQTPNGDTTDVYVVNNLQVNTTFGAPTGTPVDGQQLVIRIKDNATAHTLAWNSVYAGGMLPLSTALTKYMNLTFRYNADAAPGVPWKLVAYATEGGYASLSATPANPTAITGNVVKCFGFGNSACIIIPRTTGKLLVTFQGTASITTATNGTFVAIYGQGSTGPANGAAGTGTPFGAGVAINTLTTWFPTTMTGLVSGLTIGLPYWFDVEEQGAATTVASFTSVAFTAVELP